MSKHLKTAREAWMRAANNLSATEMSHLRASVYSLLLHLEALEQSQAAFAPSSSAATPTEEATPPTLSIYLQSLGDPLQLVLTASQAATLSPYLPAGTWAYSNIRLTHGPEPAEATGAIRINRGSIPLAGSHSPSTGEPRPEANGLVGSAALNEDEWRWGDDSQRF